MSSNDTHHDASTYYVPHGSPWPILGSVALFTLMLGVISYLNEWSAGWSFIPGALLLAIMFFGWFSTVIGESEKGMYNLDVDKSFRMGMMWFIMSEVMFFAAFFGALFYARQLSVPWIGGEGVKIFTKLLLWQDYSPAWPTNGPAKVGGHTDGSFETIHAFGLPALNTAILLTSGVTITIAHHALRAGNRKVLGAFLAAAYVSVGEHARKSVSTSTMTMVLYASSAALLIVTCIVGRQPLWGWSWRDWLLILALTVGAQLLGHTIMNKVLITTSATVVSTAILFEAPGATIIAAIALGQVPPLGLIPALALMLVGVVMVIRSGSRSVPTETSPI